MLNSKFWVKKSLHPEKQGVAGVVQKGGYGLRPLGLARRKGYQGTCDFTNLLR